MDLRDAKALIVGLAVVSCAAYSIRANESDGSSPAKPRYNASGGLLLPKEYRRWTFLSTGIGMTYGPTSTGALPFENVFVNPAAYDNFLKTGRWPDKTMLLLEVRRSESRVSINKDGRVQTQTIVGLEAHVKDDAHGGWAFYNFPAGATEGRPFPKTADCFTCHEQNGASDTTFVQFYPTLIEAAKQKGTYRDTEH